MSPTCRASCCRPEIRRPEGQPSSKRHGIDGKARVGQHCDPAGDHNSHGLADQPQGHAIEVGVDLDETVGLYCARQPHVAERRPVIERAQRPKLALGAGAGRCDAQARALN